MHFHLTPLWQFIWLVTASLIAGIMNALAGGGSFISFPAMMAMGVLPIQANATNTVALWPGQLTSVVTLRGDLRRDILPVLLGTSVLGGITGALVLLNTKQVTFLRILPWMLLGATVLFGISGPVSRWLRSRSLEPHVQKTPPLIPLACALFLVCCYIGYFGAGAGFLVMSVLALFGIEEMHQLNSLKVLANCLANLCAVFTFILHGAVVWRYCLVSMLFAALGGYIGARYARRMNADTLRAVVVVVGLMVSAYFFWRQA